MDDATSPWLRLALCPQTPNALLHELLSSPADELHQHTVSLRLWLNADKSNSAPPILLPDELQASATAWKTLAKQLSSSTVDAAVQKVTDWASAANDRHLLTPDHPLWPMQLHTLPDPPALLYAIGEPTLLAKDQIAIVGARRCSVDGQLTARQLARELAGLGWVVTSGLALGIDTEAHLGCLEGGTPTLAVMATDAATCYPRSNRQLADKILASGGCLITETPLGMPLERYCFPRRNRLISALSRGVVVVEAALKSGTITTAKHAATQGREVMAVPGSVRNPLVGGCHQLIRDGATLVTSAADVVECTGGCTGQSSGQSNELWQNNEIDFEPQHKAKTTPHGTDSPQAATLLQAMGYDAAPLERLVLHTGMGAAELVTLLTQLELQGRVSRDFAGRYSRC